MVGIDVENGGPTWDDWGGKTAPESAALTADLSPGPNPRTQSEAYMSMTAHPCDRSQGAR